MALKHEITSDESCLPCREQLRPLHRISSPFKPALRSGQGINRLLPREEELLRAAAAQGGGMPGLRSLREVAATPVWLSPLHAAVMPTVETRLVRLGEGGCGITGFAQPGGQSGTESHVQFTCPVCCVFPGLVPCLPASPAYTPCSPLRGRFTQRSSVAGLHRVRTMDPSHP